MAGLGEANLENAYALDIKIRLEDEKLPPEGVATAIEEFEQDGVVYEQGGVKVIAFRVGANWAQINLGLCSLLDEKRGSGQDRRRLPGRTVFIHR